MEFIHESFQDFLDSQVDENMALRMQMDKAKKKVIKVPGTDKQVTVATALRDEDHPAHKQAQSFWGKLKKKWDNFGRLEKDKVKEGQEFDAFIEESFQEYFGESN